VSGQPREQKLKWTEVYGVWFPSSQLIGALGSSILGTCWYNDTYSRVLIKQWTFSSAGPSLVKATDIWDGYDASTFLTAANSSGVGAVLLQRASYYRWLLFMIRNGVVSAPMLTDIDPGTVSLNWIMVSEDGLELIVKGYYTGDQYGGLNTTNGATLWWWENTDPRLNRTLIGAPKKNRHVWRNDSQPDYYYSVSANRYDGSIVPNESTWSYYDFTLYGVHDFTGETILTAYFRTSWANSSPYSDPIGVDTGNPVAHLDWDGVHTLSPGVGATGGGDGVYGYQSSSSDSILGDVPMGGGTFTGHIDYAINFPEWFLTDVELDVTVDNTSRGGGNYELRDGSQALLDTTPIDVSTTWDGQYAEKWIGNKPGQTTRVRYPTTVPGG
jgi:hypothetical protein